jgi:hypothetical protein
VALAAWGDRADSYAGIADASNILSATPYTTDFNASLVIDHLAPPSFLGGAF